MSVAIFTTIIFILHHVSIFKVKIRRERPGHILPPTNSQAPGSKAKKTSHPIDPSLFFFFSPAGRPLGQPRPNCPNPVKIFFNMGIKIVADL